METTKPLAGKIICESGKKPDVAVASKPTIVDPKGLLRLPAGKGHRCKSISTLITKVDKATIEKKITDQTSPAYTDA